MNMNNFNPFKKIVGGPTTPDKKMGVLAAAMLALGTLGTTLESCTTKVDASFKDKIENMTDQERADYAKSVYKKIENSPNVELFPSGAKNYSIIFEGGQGKMGNDTISGHWFILDQYDTTTVGADGYSDHIGKEIWLFDKNNDGKIDGIQYSRLEVDNHAPDENGHFGSRKKVYHGKHPDFISINPSEGDTLSAHEKEMIATADKDIFPYVIKLFEQATQLEQKSDQDHK